MKEFKEGWIGAVPVISTHGGHLTICICRESAMVLAQELMKSANVSCVWKIDGTEGKIAKWYHKSSSKNIVIHRYRVLCCSDSHGNNAI